MIWEPEILFKQPFASNGHKSIIPFDPTGTGKASLVEGFPPVTSMPLQAGGIAPDRLDFNGILYMLSAYAHWQQSGGLFTWKGELDYAVPAWVYRDGNYYFCIKDNGPRTPDGLRPPEISPLHWKQLTFGGTGPTDPDDPGGEIPAGDTIMDMETDSLNNIDLPVTLLGDNGVEVSAPVKDATTGDISISIGVRDAQTYWRGAPQFTTLQELINGTGGNKIISPAVLHDYIEYKTGGSEPPEDEDEYEEDEDMKIPDYANGVYIGNGTPYTAPSNGFVIGYGGGNVGYLITIDGFPVIGEDITGDSIQLRVKAGSVITAAGSSSQNNGVNFFPETDLGGMPPAVMIVPDWANATQSTIMSDAGGGNSYTVPTLGFISLQADGTPPVLINGKELELNNNNNFTMLPVKSGDVVGTSAGTGTFSISFYPAQVVSF